MVLVKVEVISRFLLKSEVLEWVINRGTRKGRSINKRSDEGRYNRRSRESSFGVLVILSSRLCYKGRMVLIKGTGDRKYIYIDLLTLFTRDGT
jgi:hypothetical protein